ncbi:ARPP-2 domain-containing protein [Nocardia sp. NPDC003963]
MTALDLSDLTTGPAQVRGGIRLVPLLRAQPVTELRLHAELYDAEIGMVDLGRHSYLSYIPHGFVADWGGDGTPAAAYGTQLGEARPDRMRLHFPHRMARRQSRTRLRFLPLHLALEGYLSLHFGGPVIAWEEWSRQALRRGLGPRVEHAYLGAEIRGLPEALRLFEIHPGQCGVLVYVADVLASAFVVPHPDDYRVLHPGLVQDLYGELIHHCSGHPPVREYRVRLPDSGIRSIADLRLHVAQQEQAWAHFHDTTMADGLLDSTYTWERVNRLGRFTLSRFLPPFRPKQENHIGESITDAEGRVVYLKTFRLAENQVRRGYLLSRLAAADWHLADTAAELGITEAELGRRLDSAGFGHLLRRDILDGYRARTRRSR